MLRSLDDFAPRIIEVLSAEPRLTLDELVARCPHTWDRELLAWALLDLTTKFDVVESPRRYSLRPKAEWKRNWVVDDGLVEEELDFDEIEEEEI